MSSERILDTHNHRIDSKKPTIDTHDSDLSFSASSVSSHNKILASHSILRLQSTVGNQAVGRMLSARNQTMIQRLPIGQFRHKNIPLDTNNPRVIHDYITSISKDKIIEIENIIRELNVIQDKSEINYKYKDFEGRAGKAEGGIYRTAAEKGANKLQAGDAEVDILQQVEKHLIFLQKEQEDERYEMKLIMSISKGPCNSCRENITLFRKNHPNIKVIVEYGQDQPTKQDTDIKHPNTEKLRYGYGKVKQTESGRFYKVFNKHKDTQGLNRNLKNPIGFKKNTLDNIVALYKKEGMPLDIKGFVDQLKLTVVTTEQRPSVVDWLKEYIRIEEQEEDFTIQDSEYDQLMQVSLPVGGEKVESNARLYYYMPVSDAHKTDAANIINDLNQMKDKIIKKDRKEKEENIRREQERERLTKGNFTMVTKRRR